MTEHGTDPGPVEYSDGPVLAGVYDRDGKLVRTLETRRVSASMWEFVEPYTLADGERLYVGVPGAGNSMHQIDAGRSQ